MYFNFDACKIILYSEPIIGLRKLIIFDSLIAQPVQQIATFSSIYEPVRLFTEFAFCAILNIHSKSHLKTTT